MGFLDGLSQGLRSAGAVLSPEVFRQVGNEDLQAERQAETRKTLLLGQAIKGVESGAVDPRILDRFQPGLSQVVGMSPEAKARVAAQQTEMAHRQEMGALDPTADDYLAKAANISVKYGKPQVAATLYTAQENRLARVQAAKDALQAKTDALEERSRQEGLNREQKAELARMADDTRRQGQQLTAQLAAGNQQLRGLQIQMMSDSKQRGEAEKEDKGIQQQVQKASTTMKDFGPALSAAQDLNKVLSQFSPDTLPGSGYLKNTDIGKAFLSDQGKNVSASVKQFGNSVLKAMSGSAVTAPEEIRQMAAQMADGRFSAQDFYIAWPKMLGWVNANSGIAAAGLSPKAKQLFQDRSGVNLDPIVPKYSFDIKQGKLVENAASTKSEIPAPPPGFKVD